MDQDDSQLAARFFALIKTELGAEVARLLPPGTPPPEATNAVWHRLEDGRTVVAVFAEPPADILAVARKLAMLVQAVSVPPGLSVHKSRVSVTRSLKDELCALAKRAVAVDALVIDADSPVVWGSASNDAFRPQRPDYSTAVLTDAEASHDWNDVSATDVAGQAGEANTDELAAIDGGSAHAVELALAHVRGLDALQGLAKGKPLVHHHIEDEFAVAAHSFSSIYLLLLVYDGAFDELRAERAMAEALPRIEDLVSALPPLDPEPAPMAGVVRIGRKRR